MGEGFGWNWKGSVEDGVRAGARAYRTRRGSWPTTVFVPAERLAVSRTVAVTDGVDVEAVPCGGMNLFSFMFCEEVGNNG